jgi:hypothetical protein
MWTVDPDLTDTTYRTDFAIMLRDHRGDTRVVHDSHIEGVFPRAEWMRLLREAGFAASTLTDEWGREIFVCETSKLSGRICCRGRILNRAGRCIRTLAFILSLKKGEGAERCRGAKWRTSGG